MTPLELAQLVAAGHNVSPADGAAALLARAIDPQATRRRERHAAIRARDDALVNAAVCLSVDHPALWVLAERLRAAIARFQAGAWPRILAGLSVTLSPSETALRVAFTAGVGVPASRRQLYELLKLSDFKIQ